MRCYRSSPSYLVDVSPVAWQIRREQLKRYGRNLIRGAFHFA